MKTDQEVVDHIKARCAPYEEAIYLLGKSFAFEGLARVKGDIPICIYDYWDIVRDTMDRFPMSSDEAENYVNGLEVKYQRTYNLRSPIFVR